MRAVRFHRPGEVSVDEIRRPEPGPHQVLLRPEVVGLCGTDAHIVAGHFPAASPVVLGHEVAGVVEAVGEGVLGVVPGDLVAIEPHRYCGVCRYCRLGREHLCVAKEGFGVRLDGGLAEAMVVPAEVAYAVPPGMSAALASFAEPVGCCVHGLDRLEPKPGLPLLIFGGGPIGAILLRLAMLAGLGPVTVIEPRRERRDAMLRFGADAAIDPSEDDWRCAARAISGEEGYDFVIDAVGRGDVLESAMTLCARGGRILVFGVATPNETASLRPNEIYEKELTVLGSVINPFTHQRALSLLPRLGLDALSTEQFGLEDFSTALSAQSAARIGKVQVLPQRSS